MGTYKAAEGLALTHIEQEAGHQIAHTLSNNSKKKKKNE